MKHFYVNGVRFDGLQNDREGENGFAKSAQSRWVISFIGAFSYTVLLSWCNNLHTKAKETRKLK